MFLKWHRVDFCRRLALSLPAVFCSLCFMTGCGGGSKGPTIYPAKGMVKLDGKPAYGALVVLHPVDKDQSIRPGGGSDDAGQFILTSVKPQDGAPAGDYLIAVHWYESSASPAPAQVNGLTGMGGEGESKTDPVDRLQGRYSNPETSGLKCTIEENDNEIPTFELRSDFGTPVGPGGPVIDGA